MIASWWDSPGAAIVLTGIVTVAAVAIPTVLRPWVEGRVHRQQHQEDATDHWFDEARGLCIELEVLLEKCEMGTLLASPGTSATLATWDHSLRRRTALVTRFGPTALL